MAPDDPAPPLLLPRPVADGSGRGRARARGRSRARTTDHRRRCTGRAVAGRGVGQPINLSARGQPRARVAPDPARGRTCKLGQRRRLRRRRRCGQLAGRRHQVGRAQRDRRPARRAGHGDPELFARQRVRHRVHAPRHHPVAALASGAQRPGPLQGGQRHCARRDEASGPCGLRRPQPRNSDQAGHHRIASAVADGGGADRGRRCSPPGYRAAATSAAWGWCSRRGRPVRTHPRPGLGPFHRGRQRRLRRLGKPRR